MTAVDGQTRAESEHEVNEWIRFGMRLGVSAALHPFEYSKVLIQLGYEPILARPGTSFFGQRVMVLPNIIQYTGHIRKIDGFHGCYRGLTPKIIGTVVSMIASDKIAEHLNLKPLDKDDPFLSDEELYNVLKYNLKRDIVLSVSSIIVSQPFHVISLRMMAQFVGRETLYNTVVGSITEIYKTEGIMGFFAGIVPKLLCDIACLVLTSSAVYIVDKVIAKDKFIRQYNTGVVQFIVSNLLYPLQVVSTCTAVNGSRLMVARPPLTPIYNNWIDCWNDLKSRGELKRGSSLFWRYQTVIRQSNFSNVDLPTISRYQ